MLRPTQKVFLVSLVLFAFALPLIAHARSAVPAPALQSSLNYAVVDAVNALRAEYGLGAYIPNEILMQIAQEHADYQMRSGSMGHISADGLKPFQRALQAGYAVAGDIYTNVGWFSENIVAGFDMTPEQAVEEWAVMDEAHLKTMISPNLVDIGAGVAVDGNYYIYVIDCGRSTGGTAVPLVQPSTYNTRGAPLALPTPNADGEVWYSVQANDTLLGIALTYGMSLDAIYALNSLNENSTIYPGDLLLLSAAITPTPTQPTLTITPRPTNTPWIVSTTTEIPATIPVSNPLPGGRSTSEAGSAVAAIVVTALLLAGLLTFVGIKQKR
jgi:uncharacterized protein YkwD/LysM repeat protein